MQGIVVQLPAGIELSDQDLQFLNKITAKFSDQVVAVIGDQLEQGLDFEVRSNGAIVIANDTGDYLRKLGLSFDMTGKKLGLAFTLATKKKPRYEFVLEISQVKIYRGDKIEFYFQAAKNFSAQQHKHIELESPIVLRLPEKLGGMTPDNNPIWIVKVKDLNITAYDIHIEEA